MREVLQKSRKTKIVTGVFIVSVFLLGLYLLIFLMNQENVDSGGNEDSDRNWEEYEDTDFAFKFMHPPDWRHVKDSSGSEYGLTWQEFASPLDDEEFTCGSDVSKVSMIASISEIEESEYFDWLVLESAEEIEFKGKSASRYILTDETESCCVRKDAYKFSNAGYEYFAAAEIYVPIGECETAEITAERFFENVWYLDPESTVTKVNFDDTGVLQQDESGDWVLLYEDEDGDANTAVLVFENASLCDMGSGIGYCEETLFEDGSDVIVEGHLDDNTLEISRMIKIKF